MYYSYDVFYVTSLSRTETAIYEISDALIFELDYLSNFLWKFIPKSQNLNSEIKKFLLLGSLIL